MGFYDERILPHMINFACGAKPVRKQREKVVPHAEGRILEVGIGSGLNIEFYDPDKVDMVWGLEPSHGMREKARPQVEAAPFPIEWLDLAGRGDSAGRQQRRHHRDDLYAVHHSGLESGTATDAPRAQARRQAAVQRTRRRPGCVGAPLAGPHQPLLEQDRRRLQPEPGNPPPDQGKAASMYGSWMRCTSRRRRGSRDIPIGAMPLEATHVLFVQSPLQPVYVTNFRSEGVLCSSRIRNLARRDADAQATLADRRERVGVRCGGPAPLRHPCALELQHSAPAWCAGPPYRIPTLGAGTKELFRTTSDLKNIKKTEG